MTLNTSLSASSPPPIPGLSELFWSFARISIYGFGGVLPFARHTIVEEKKWLTEVEFAELFSFFQFIPGGNVINLSANLGYRFHGFMGICATWLGLLLPVTGVLLILGPAYTYAAQVPLLQSLMNGLSAAAAGLIMATALKMSRSLRNWAAWMITAVTAISMGVYQVPLRYVLLLVLPSIALQRLLIWWKTRQSSVIVRGKRVNSDNLADKDTDTQGTSSLPDRESPTMRSPDDGGMTVRAGSVHPSKEEKSFLLNGESPTVRSPDDGGMTVRAGSVPPSKEEKSFLLNGESPTVRSPDDGGMTVRAGSVHPSKEEKS